MQGAAWLISAVRDAIHLFADEAEPNIWKRNEITSASKAYASAGKEIVALGQVTKFMLQLDTAVEKQSTA